MKENKSHNNAFLSKVKKGHISLKGQAEMGVRKSEKDQDFKLIIFSALAVFLKFSTPLTAI